MVDGLPVMKGAGERYGTFTVRLPTIYHRPVGRGIMATKKIETVCGYSCSDCDHYRNECAGCAKTKGTPFWVAFMGIERCAIYDCCNNRKLPHCGKCPDLMCERFNRIRDDPHLNEAEAAACLIAMERELRARK